MYALIGLASIFRIAAAMLLLFVVIPHLAWGRPRHLSRLEWFWWNFGIGITLLTLVGQLLTLLNIASSGVYLLLLAALVVSLRARRAGVTPAALLRSWYRNTVRLALHLMERRVHVARRLRRYRRALIARQRAMLDRNAKLHIAAWTALLAIAGAIRFYRPLASANLGFSDTYVHLFLMRLLDEGRQVDPAWGPYPRGMHFVLLAIDRLTNVDAVLLMNFFGAFAGVLMTLAVADAALRLTGRLAAGIASGLLFATMIGGASQYFVLGGVFLDRNRALGTALLKLPYSRIPGTAGEFDLLLTAFSRQTATLPQELAVVLLFPAALFLLSYFRSSDRWHLTGFIGCTAAIAAVHPGVVIPLLLLCGASVAAALCEVGWRKTSIRTGALAGAAAIAIGSTWMLALFRYSYIGDSKTASTSSHAGATALYYFPFLRPLAGGGDPVAALQRVEAFTSFTPLLIVCAIVAVVFLLAASRVERAHRGGLVWSSVALALFLITHLAATLRLPAVVEVRRNAIWLTMSIALLLGIALVYAGVLAMRALQPSARRTAGWITAMAAGLAWLFTVPNPASPAVREKLVNYSGYGTTAYALIRITREFEPFTWTFISYGQEYPMVLGRGFHLSATDFLEGFDPAAPVLMIPTRYVFVSVEKNPHHFEVTNWSARFSRKQLEDRLQTWCFLYQRGHNDMRVFHEDDDVRVYMIERSEAEANRIAEQVAAK